MIIPSEDELLAVAAKLASVMVAPFVIYLSGPLGAGKTTFTRGFLGGYGYKGAVKSPTYTLVESYELPQATVHHFDLYRIHDPEELELIGIRDYFNRQSICLIEWPEQAQGFLPKPDLLIVIEIIAEGRLVNLTSGSSLGASMLQQFNAIN